MKNVNNLQLYKELSQEMKIDLPKVAEPFFKNYTFQSKNEMKEKIALMNQVFENNKNSATIESLNEFFNAKISHIKLPLYGSTVSCGFTSPAEDHVENQLSLDDYLVPNPDATFFVRASGDSMTGAGIFDGDLLIIDRSIEVKSNQIVLAVLDTEFTVKRFLKAENKITLKAENQKFKDIVVSKNQHFMVWGVVVHVIHHLK